MKKTRQALILAVVMALLVPASALGASGEGTSGFSSEPAVDGHIDQSRSRFTYQVAPGQSVTDQVFVSNTGSTDIQLLVYAADANTTLDGTFDVATNALPAKDVGRWVTFQNGASQVIVNLKHDRGIALPFTLAVPSTATPGDHVGGIAVSTIAPLDGQIQIQRRIVTRMYARVQGDLNPSLTVTSISSNYNPSWNPFDGTAVVQFTVANTGNVSLQATAITQVFNAIGMQVGQKTRGNLKEILPGTSRLFALSVPHVGQWVYLDPTVTLIPKVEKDALNPGVLTHIHRNSPLWIIPYSWLVILLVLAGVWNLVRRRVSKRNKEIAKWLEFTAQDAKRKAAEGKQ